MREPGRRKHTKKSTFATVILLMKVYTHLQFIQTYSLFFITRDKLPWWILSELCRTVIN